MKNNIWRKFFECSCGAEGVMIGYDYKEEGIPLIDMAFFQSGMDSSRKLGIWQRIRWSWNIIKNGIPFLDQVTINQNTAKQLGKELIEFSEKKYKYGD